MTINLKNFLSDKSKLSKMGEFQDLKPLDGLEVSSISADLYNNGRDDLALFYFKEGANYATLNTTNSIVSSILSLAFQLRIFFALEVSSCSNFESFQTRRGNIKFKNKQTNKLEFLHTINGSGLATPRLMVSLLETYQNEDSTISIPDILKPYLNFNKIC